MQYKGYQNKINRIAEKLSRIYAKRFIILPLTVLTLAALSALLYFKGSLLSVGTCPAMIEFGDKAAYHSYALLGRTDLEYAPAESEAWSYAEELPIGNYKTRAVAWSLTGKPRYSEIQTLTVAPRRLILTVSGTELMYGNSPDFSAEGLRPGDRVEVGFEVISNTKTAIALRVKTEDAVVYDKNGVDVTKNYIIEQTATRILTLTQRPITLKSESATKVYDLEPLYCDKYSITEGSLAAGDSIEIINTTKINLADTIYNRLSYQIKNADGQDVTDQYLINNVSGQLTITPRPIGIGTPDAAAVYDGTALSAREAWLTRTEDIEFFEKHSLTLTIVGNPAQIDCGTVQNDVGVMIVPPKGSIDPQNYTIVYDKLGTLTVKPRPITVITADGEFTFNGDNHFFPQAYVDPNSEYGLVSGHTINAMTYNFMGFVNAGTYDNVGIVHIYAGLVDETSNYDITYKPGKIVGHKLRLTLTPETTEKYYDGQAQKTNQEVIVNKELQDLLDRRYSYKVIINGSLTKPGTIASEIVDFKLYFQEYYDDSINIVDVTYNIDPILEKGVFTILPRMLFVKTGSISAYYSGDRISALTINLTNMIKDEPNSLAYGHKYEVIDPPLFTQIGIYKNEFNIKIVDRYGNDVSDCYYLEYEYGRIVIMKIPIVISTGSKTAVYSGLEISNNEIKIRTFGQFADQEKYFKVIVEAPASYTDVGQYENAPKVRIIDIRTNKDVDDKYELCFEYGVITIEPRPIKVRTDSGAALYDGQPVQFPNIKTSGSLAAVGGYEVYAETVSLTDVGIHNNSITSLRIMDTVNDRDVTHNYDISYEIGTITISPLDLLISTSGGEFTFDGKPHTFPSLDLYGTLAHGHSYKITEAPEFINAGIGFNDLKVAIYDENGRDVTKNYNFNWTYGRVTVNSLPITLRPKYTEKYYDGTPLRVHGIDGGEALSALLELGYQCKFEIIGYRLAVGTSVSTISYFELFDQSGYSVTNNLKLTFETGKITVLENTHSVFITLKRLSKLYDSTPLTLNSPDDVSVVSIPEGINVEYIIPNLSITEVGSLTITEINKHFTDYFDYKIVDKNGNDVSENYRIAVTFSELTSDISADDILTIRARRIHLTSASETAIYYGKPLKNEQITLSQGSLVQGHKPFVVIDVELDLADGIDEVTAENVISSYKILDESGNDVTANYNVTKTYGTLTLKR